MESSSTVELEWTALQDENVSLSIVEYEELDIDAIVIAFQLHLTVKRENKIIRKKRRGLWKY